ncbi:site-specific DNA-methyltransferase [Brevundimonas sp.]|uniref:DNA-methyltransferase n=1 Tax=Brevundimonas sp. TaxID=1871086 RepID=UPI0028A8D367|nr:site-specific DNA-methyltransferase [Brevundimonas sp.]
MGVKVHHGDSREVLKGFADASIDSVVCDPPYALVSVLQRFGKSPRSEATENTANPYGRTGRGFMGQRWDTGETAFDPEFWRGVRRVMKPGAHLLAFGGTRTFGELQVAIAAAGFEIRDTILDLVDPDGAVQAFLNSLDEEQLRTFVKCYDDATWGGLLAWIFGSGFPKSHNQKGEWEGYGSALKPAFEPIVVARVPMIGTIAANLAAHRTGALNIDGCRIEATDDRSGGFGAGNRPWQTGAKGETNKVEAGSLGRWPANVIHDGSVEVADAFPQSNGQQGAVGPQHGARPSVNVYGDYGARDHFSPRGDAGSAARFFYSSKADAADRCGSKHPTVKPIDLMAYLCRLVTPPGGVVLDPFAGSGSTGMACLREGFDCVLIEREAQYVEDIHRRLKHVEGADTPLFSTDAAPQLFGDAA